MTQSIHTKNHGFTLVETAIVLTIVGLIIGGIWLGAATVQGNIKKNKVSEQTLRVAQNVKNFYLNQQSTVGLDSTSDIESIIDAGLVPDDMIKGGGGTQQIVHAFAGEVDILSQPSNPANGSVASGGFSVTLNGLPLDVCVDLLSSRIAGNASTAKKIGFFGYTGGTVATTPQAPSSTTIPADLDTATAECRSGDFDADTKLTRLTLFFDMN